MTSELMLQWPGYRLFPYERRLALREATALLTPHDSPHESDQGVCVLTHRAWEAAASSLTYFSQVRENETVVPTTQGLIERSGSNGNGIGKQITRYSVHGLHEYKGKFNPQVAHAILNCFRLPANARVLDPFCGSGTTLVESSQKNLRAVGLDLNPLAVYVAQTKLKALRTPANAIEKILGRVIASARKRRRTPRSDGSDRFTYLKSWFDGPILSEIEGLRQIIDETDSPGAAARILKVIISDQLRDFSFQDPMDLRIRRRTTPLPSTSILEVFEEKARSFVSRLSGVQAILRNVAVGRVLRLDSTSMSDSQFKKLGKFDAVVSSPPYATALPYIDTQRLSLVWLGLCQPSGIMQLQTALTGSREFYKQQKAEWKRRLLANADKLPKVSHAFCLSLQDSMTTEDGFRRQAVPSLLYRYLVAMQQVLHALFRMTTVRAQAAFIVGHNHTVLGGHRFDIDTPSLIANLMHEAGFKNVERLPLETYQRYGIHYKNAISKEELILFQRR
jgi:16S rRNA G966 N2-methylase RsmD